MRTTASIGTLMAVVMVAGVNAVPSQTAQPPARGSAQKRAAAPARTSSVRIAVKDQDGGSLNGVRLLLSGAGTGEFVTGAAGTTVVPNLKEGEYRLRCE